MVHLDIKPENIFLALEHLPSTPSDNDEAEDVSLTESKSIELFNKKLSAYSSKKKSKNVLSQSTISTDSGNASSDNYKSPKNYLSSSDTGSPSVDRVSYKIGDLGHVVMIHGEYLPEEGDCRYMAPELLLHDVNRDNLTKADIFSLGLTLYECATLKPLPKNSMEDPLYEKIREGNIPPVPGYSKEFNQLVRVSLLKTN